MVNGGRFESIKNENKAIIRHAKEQLDSFAREWNKSEQHRPYYMEKAAKVIKDGEDLIYNANILEELKQEKKFKE